MSASWSKKVKGKRFTVEEYALHLIERYGGGARNQALRLAHCSTHDHTRFWYFAVAVEIREQDCDRTGGQDRIDHREISAEEHAFLMLSRYGTRAREYALDRMGRAALEDTRQHYAVVAERISEIRQLLTEPSPKPDAQTPSGNPLDVRERLKLKPPPKGCEVIWVPDDEVDSGLSFGLPGRGRPANEKPPRPIEDD